MVHTVTSTKLLALHGLRLDGMVEQSRQDEPEVGFFAGHASGSHMPFRFPLGLGRRILEGVRNGMMTRRWIRLWSRKGSQMAWDGPSSGTRKVCCRLRGDMAERWRVG